MAKLHVLTAALALAGSVAFAQTATTTERTEVTRSNNGASSTKTTTKVTQTQYVDQLRTVYTSAGVQESKIERLIELDRKIYQAWLAGDQAAVRRYRLEQRQILEADELQKVHVYFQSHPLPAHFPDFVVNTWAPEGTFNPDITVSTTRTGAASGSINVGSGTSAGTSSEVGGAASSPSTAGGSVSGSGSTDTSISGSSGTGSSVSGSSGTSAGAAGTAGTGSSSNLSGSSSTGASGTMSGSTGSGTSGSTGATGSTGTGSSASGSGSSTGSASGSGSSQ